MLEPFLVERRLVPKVWGGRALSESLGIPLPPGGQSYGESWELFDRADGSSHIRGAGVTLAELMRRDPVALVGRGVPLGHGGRFPLLLKFLDAREGLSLQVHPDDRRAQLDSGKDECCYVMDAGEQSRIVHGVRPGVTREQFLEKWETAEVEDLLYSFRPEIGDLVHIPPGMVHGIGPGVLAFEIQQNSDLTYRFYDWGRGRELHLEQARRVLDVVAHEQRPVERSTALPDGGDLLLVTGHFTVRRYLTKRPVTLPTDGRYLTVTVLGGGCTLRRSERGQHGRLSMSRCDTALVPACVAGVVVEPDEQVEMIVCGPGAWAHGTRGAGAR